MSPALERLLTAAKVVLADRIELRDSTREWQQRSLRAAIEEVELEERVAAERTTWNPKPGRCQETRDLGAGAMLVCVWPAHPSGPHGDRSGVLWNHTIEVRDNPGRVISAPGPDPAYHAAIEGEAAHPIRDAIHAQLDTLCPSDPAQMPAWEQVRDSILELVREVEAAPTKRDEARRRLDDAINRVDSRIEEVRKR